MNMKSAQTFEDDFECLDLCIAVSDSDPFFSVKSGLLKRISFTTDSIERIKCDLDLIGILIKGY